MDGVSAAADKHNVNVTPHDPTRPTDLEGLANELEYAAERMIVADKQKNNKNDAMVMILDIAKVFLFSTSMCFLSRARVVLFLAVSTTI